MFSRSLASLPIPSTAISALHHAGFQTVDDLGSLSAEQLSEGKSHTENIVNRTHAISTELDLPGLLCEEIIRTSKSKIPALTQPATSLLDATRLSFPICKPVDLLLGNNGLKRGCVLELSGPPGSPKEQAVINLVKSVLEADGEVLFVGKSFTHCAIEWD